ncbi:MAG: Pr6Pr family membrane protein, partial [Nocardioidaceae bacterium]
MPTVCPGADARRVAAFGPWGRIDRRVIGTVIWWPIGYFGYTQVLGRLSSWYPYPFLDADEHGTGQVLVNAAVVTV